MLEEKLEGPKIGGREEKLSRAIIREKRRSDVSGDGAVYRGDITIERTSGNIE